MALQLVPRTANPQCLPESSDLQSPKLRPQRATQDSQPRQCPQEVLSSPQQRENLQLPLDSKPLKPLCPLRKLWSAPQQLDVRQLGLELHKQ